MFVEDQFKRAMYAITLHDWAQNIGWKFYGAAISRRRYNQVNSTFIILHELTRRNVENDTQALIHLRILLIYRYIAKKVIWL